MPIGPIPQSPLPIRESPPTPEPRFGAQQARAPSAPSTEVQSPFAQLLRGLGHEEVRGESLVRSAVASASGGELAPAALLALQAGVYRYSEVVDLVARLVDHATTAVKTVVQNQ